jgi:uncharacterized membrane protein YkoI
MRPLIVALTLLGSFSATAAELKCSIHPAKGTAASALPGLTKITQAEAKNIALAGFKGRSASVSEGELEVERNCLIYSFDIRVHAKTGIDEVMVDAGTGAIISKAHETPRQEAAEAAADKAAAAEH